MVTQAESIFIHSDEWLVIWIVGVREWSHMKLAGQGKTTGCHTQYTHRAH